MDGVSPCPQLKRVFFKETMQNFLKHKDLYLEGFQVISWYAYLEMILKNPIFVGVGKKKKNRTLQTCPKLLGFFYVFPKHNF